MIETGTHDELMLLNSHYAQLVSRQLAGSEPTEVIVNHEVIVPQEVIIEKDKIVGKSGQGAYDSL